MCSAGCSNWGNRIISQYPIMSHVAFLFIKRLENATVNVDIGKSLSMTQHTNPCRETVRLKHYSLRFAYLCIPAIHKYICISRQCMKYITKNISNYKGC